MTMPLFDWHYDYEQTYTSPYDGVTYKVGYGETPFQIKLNSSFRTRKTALTTPGS